MDPTFTWNGEDLGIYTEIWWDSLKTVNFKSDKGG